jgi:hypothetical protein
MRSLHSVHKARSKREYLDMQALEEVLACNIKDVIADFCLTDSEIIRFYVDNQLHGNMDEMMNSSAELYFKGETLSYGHVAHVSSEAGESSCVTLDMEFAHEAVSVFFQLVFGHCYIGVKISKVVLGPKLKKSGFSPSVFAEILTSARLMPLPHRFQSTYGLADAARH